MSSKHTSLKSIYKHQIYTPITIIKGYVSMLQEKNYGEISKEAEQILSIIDKSVDTLVETLQRLKL